ncbi:MAG TPA: LacI family DNA-binding transcriptional regulator [Terriglobales bacterium]|nr:LacI family DNA-binding transcriptional regulator [Terriglobales bacterium]
MATIKEIAKAAGVSIGTASNVINGLSTVRAASRKRVLDAIDTLGYQPSMLGRALRKEKTNMIVMIVPDITNPFFPAAVRGAEDIAFQNGYRLVLCNSDNDSSKEASYIREMQTYRPSGLIIVPAEQSRSLEGAKAYVKAGSGVVYLDRIPPKWHGDCVTSAHEEGAYAATRHLIEIGHYRIATITGPLTATSAIARLNGYRRAMKAARLSVPANYIQEAEFNMPSGHAKATLLLQTVPRPTAIFAGNDLIALGVLTAIREAKLECPREVSVVGFDNLAESDVTLPTLTTVDQSAYQLGAQAAQAVIERAGRKSGPARHIVLAPQLRVKGSTAPPPGNNMKSRSARSRH